jgi:FkbM family methyltransferase
MKRSELTGKTVVDIGANRGIYSYLMHKQVGKQGRVIAFEPQPELVEYLQNVKHRFQLSHLQIVEQALSAEVGVMKLMRPKLHWGGASLTATFGQEVDEFNVQVNTLDGFFERHPVRPIGFIKCDVEHHEYEVFLGAKRILKEDRPLLLLENSDAYMQRECRVFSYLQSLGYAGFFFLPQGLTPVSEFEQNRTKLFRHTKNNFAFVPQESLAHSLRYRTAG